MTALRASRILMKAVKAARQAEKLDDENDGEFTMADEDSVFTHIIDCFALVAAMQKEQHIPATAHSVGCGELVAED